MANICCTGVTECDHIITILYYESFIGTEIHSSSNDSVLSVNNSDDTYCPTYGELTGGSLIQNYQQGSTPNSDRDGIIVGGSYSSNQCVREGDLSMSYTRFKSFTISVSPTTISECGGSATLSFSHKYTRYTKTHASGCESTTVSSSEASDTAANEVTWNSVTHGSISYPTYSIGKNGSVSASSRSDTVSAYVVFRGSTKNSNSVTVTQNALTGDYYYWKDGSSAYTEYDQYRISPWDFGCDGGTWYGTAYYSVYTTTWDVYRWKDSCNVNYDSLTEIRNKVGPSKTNSYTESHGSGTVSSIDCSTLSSDYDSGSIYEYYDGKGDWWQQKCKACAGCNDYTAYTYTPVTVACADPSWSADVPYTWTAYTASVDDKGVCIYTSGDTGSSSYNVTGTCDNTSSDSNVTVTGVPCCSTPPACVTGVTYSFPSLTIDCNKADHITVHSTDGDITITTVYEDSSGNCQSSSDTITDKSIWCTSGECIAANDSGSDRPLSWDVYLVGTSLYLGSGSGGTKVGSISVTQSKCGPCQPGTDDAYGAYFHLSCTNQNYTSDHYCDSYWGFCDQAVYGRDQATGEKANVYSNATSGSISNWSDYLEWCDAECIHNAFPGGEGLTELNNSYGFKAKRANNTGQPIYVRVDHQLISSETTPKSDTCSEWYSICEFNTCDNYTYTVNSNVEGATVDFYSNDGYDYYYGNATISNGSCSKTIGFNLVKVIISKSGCTFSPNTDTMTEGGTVTLNGTC